MTQHLRDMPMHIINDFQFNDESANLMAYALDMHRLGATIGPNFWETRIVENVDALELDSIVRTTGPVIAAKRFDVFETAERSRRNAAIIFDALAVGSMLLIDELLQNFVSSQGIRINLPNKFSRELQQYLNCCAQEKDFRLMDSQRVQAAALCDSEPVLLMLRVEDDIQYVWNGEWRCLLGAPEETRLRHMNSWAFNHVFTAKRLGRILTRYLREKFPEAQGVSV